MIQVGILGAFFGGLLSLISPCAALLLPSFFAYAFDRVGTLAARTGMFYLGLAVTLVPLGAGVGAVGSLITRHPTIVTTVGGIVLIGLGVLTVFGKGFGIGAAQRLSGRIKISSGLSVFALGLVYGLAGGLCSGPLLGSVLTVSAAGGNPVYGGLLMAVYALGMAFPLFVIALLWDRFRLGQRQWLRGRELRIGPLRAHTTSLVSGLLFIGIGLLFLLTEGTANLGGIAGVDTQDTLEEWVQQVTSGTSSTVVLLVLVLLALAIIVARVFLRLRRQRTEQTSPGQDT